MGPSSAAFVREGDIIAGKYRVERVLGQGGMGLVTAAMHVDLHERRAIKFMLPSCLGDAEFVERFMREARACARLKSRHVATVYDVGRLDNGAPYIVMEYLEGVDLKTLLRDRRLLPIHEAVGYVLQACEAIGEAHQLGVIHRDIKPANMFLASDVGGAPCVKVLDFGIAKLVPTPGSGPDHHDMTTTNMIMGSPLYMSPEQMRSSRYVDARADIWSLGVVLYVMVTGAHPFHAEATPELCAMVLTKSPPRPSDMNPAIPPELDSIILRCLEKDPANRWPRIADLVNALRPYADPQAEPDRTEHAVESITHVWRAVVHSIPLSLGAPQGVGKGMAVQMNGPRPQVNGAARALAHGFPRVAFAAATAGILLLAGVAMFHLFRDAAPVSTSAVDPPVVDQEGSTAISTQPPLQTPAQAPEVIPAPTQSAAASVSSAPSALPPKEPSMGQLPPAATNKINPPAAPLKKSSQDVSKNPYGRERK